MVTAILGRGQADRVCATVSGVTHVHDAIPKQSAKRSSRAKLLGELSADEAVRLLHRADDSLCSRTAPLEMAFSWRLLTSTANS